VVNVNRLQKPLLSLAVDHRGSEIKSRERHRDDRGLDGGAETQVIRGIP
jgi:hypothetical protein